MISLIFVGALAFGAGILIGGYLTILFVFWITFTDDAPQSDRRRPQSPRVILKETLGPYA